MASPEVSSAHAQPEVAPISGNGVTGRGEPEMKGDNFPPKFKFSRQNSNFPAQNSNGPMGAFPA